jgi:hypothetical protein
MSGNVTVRDDDPTAGGVAKLGVTDPDPRAERSEAMMP